jgi:hypothetical protein
VLDLGKDVRRLPSRQSALVIGIAGSASLLLSGNDVDVTRSVAASPAFDRIFEPGEVIGGGVVQGGAALATFVVGRAIKNPEISWLGADLVRAQILNALLTHGIKLAVDRQRPDGGSRSFPSGHTSSSFATASVLQRHFGWRVGIPAYGVATLIAGSRLQENQHFLSDVIFGAAIGVVAGRAVVVGQGRAAFIVAPFSVAGGGGVGLTLVGAQ